MKPFLSSLMLLPLAVLVMAGSIAPANAADREDAEEALRAGIQAFNNGDRRTANVHLLNALQEDPQFGLAQAVFGRVQLSLGQYGIGRQALARALKQGIKPTRISHLLGEAALEQGRFDEALRLLDPAAVAPKFRAYAARIRGRTYYAMGDIAQTSASYEQARVLNPKSAELWIDLARFRRDMGDEGGAIEAAQNALRFGPKNPDAFVLMGEMARNQYGLLAAIPWFEKALEQDSQNVRALIELAATYGDSGQNRMMLATSRRILAIDQNNARAFYFQAVMAARANKPDLARSLLYRVGDRMDTVYGVMLLKGILEFQSGAHEQAAIALRPLVDVQPGNDRARRLMGAALYQAGEFDGAIATLLPIARRSDADSYTLSIIGRAHEAMNRRAEAAQFLDRARTPETTEPSPFDIAMPDGANDPNNPAFAVPQIAQLISNGRAVEALSRARYLQQQNPGVPETSILVGDSLDALGKFNEAAAAYQQAANIRFNEGTALRFVRALIKAERGEEAMKVLDTFISQNPRSVPMRMLLADYYLAAQKWDSAIAVLEAIRMQVGNRDVVVLDNLAWAWLNKDQPEKALSYARAAYDIAPTNAVVTGTYGWTLYASGRNTAKGRAMLEKAVATAPDNPDLKYQLAQVWAATGKKKEARAIIEALLKNPEFRDKAQAKAVLKGL